MDLLESGERIKQETRHWDEEGGRTRSGRSKEEADDYRYFQEPDLVPLDPGPDWIAAIDRQLPPMPSARRAILRERTGGADEAVAIAVLRDLDSLALAAIDAGGDPQRVLTHIEHNLAVIAHADRVIDMGPGAGHDGGRVVFEGTPAGLATSGTLTGQHLPSYLGGG